MSGDLLAAAALLVAGVVWATRGGGDAWSRWVELHDERREALRPPARPSVSAPGRPVNPFGTPGPRAIEWVDCEILPDPYPLDRPALPQYPVIDIEARDVEPLPAPVRRALQRRRLAIEPPHPNRGRDNQTDREAGAIAVLTAARVLAGLAVALILVARWFGAA